MGKTRVKLKSWTSHDWEQYPNISKNTDVSMVSWGWCCMILLPTLHQFANSPLFLESSTWRIIQRLIIPVSKSPTVGFSYFFCGWTNPRNTNQLWSVAWSSQVSLLTLLSWFLTCENLASDRRVGSDGPVRCSSNGQLTSSYGASAVASSG